MRECAIIILSPPIFTDQIADFLINEALKRRGIDINQVKKIDDNFARQARDISLRLPR